MNNKKELSIDDFNNIFATACAMHEQGLLDEAKSGYEQLLSHFSEALILHYNLGLVYFEMGEMEKAETCFEKGKMLAPDDLDVRFNLALTRKKLGKLEQAIEEYQYIIQQDAASVDALYNLAGCYREAGDFSVAVELYARVLELDSDHISSHSNIAYLYHLQGEMEHAVGHFKKVLELRPDHNSAAHMLAALTGKEVTSSPETYVREVFDNYSKRYEHSLVEELEYDVPQRMRILLELENLVGNDVPKWRNGVDLGCGTGLSGLPFAGCVETLDGVDLSAKMVALAREKDIYNRLLVGTIDDFFDTADTKYDFFLAADVLGYIGDLGTLFRQVKKNAAPNAMFCFSTEHLDEGLYRLRPSGRFAHSVNYVNKLAEEHGFLQLFCEGANLRKDRDAWVRGCIWGFRCNVR